MLSLPPQLVFPDLINCFKATQSSLHLLQSIDAGLEIMLLPPLAWHRNSRFVPKSDLRFGRFQSLWFRKRKRCSACL